MTAIDFNKDLLIFDEVVKTQNRDDITKYSKTRNESYLAII